LRRLQVATTDGRSAVLAATIAPGVTANVDAALKTAPTTAAGAAPGISCSQVGCQQTGPSGSSDREAAVMAEAASSVVDPDGQVQALTGIADPVPGFLVNGTQPNRSVIAAFVLPIQLESVDNLPANWSAPRLVAGNGLSGDPVSVIDYELPRLPADAQLKISVGAAASIGSPGAPGSAQPVIQLYNWASGAWEPTDLSHAFLLSAGERGPNLVRLRVQGSLYLQGLQVVTP